MTTVRATFGKKINLHLAFECRNSVQFGKAKQASTAINSKKYEKVANAALVLQNS